MNKQAQSESLSSVSPVFAYIKKLLGAVKNTYFSFCCLVLHKTPGELCFWWGSREFSCLEKLGDSGVKWVQAEKEASLTFTRPSSGEARWNHHHRQEKTNDDFLIFLHGHMIINSYTSVVPSLSLKEFSQPHSILYHWITWEKIHWVEMAFHESPPYCNFPNNILSPT